jgi:hypothetical protein
VYGELDRLSADELDTLARLLRGDTGQLLDRIDAARAPCQRDRHAAMRQSGTRTITTVS